MDTLFKCWTSCIPACAKSSKCLCPIGRRQNRVGPSQPIKVIHATNLDESNKPATADADKRLRLNGETNLHFQGDEVTFIPGELGSSLHGTEGNGSVSNGINGHSHSSSNGDCSHSEPNTPSTCGLDLDLELTKAYYAFLSTVYVQLTKDKKLRVIHIKPNPEPKDPSKRKHSNARSTSRTEVDTANTPSSSESSSDDEEYWFTRWSRRPKLKNVFKPKPEKGEVLEPRGEVVVELNSKFKFEDIPEEKEVKERASLKGMFRRSSSTSITEPSNLRNSQTNANYSNAISSDSCSRPCEDTFEGTATASDTLSFSSFDCHSQLELVRERTEPHDLQNAYCDRGDSPPPAFTNFAFQSDSEDEDAVDEDPEPSSPNERSKTDDVDRRHFEADIHASSVRRKSGDLLDVSQLKVNGDLLERRGSIHSLRCSQREKRKSREAEKEAPDPATKKPDTSKPILFLIHGISGSCETWKSQFEYFHDYGFEIIAPDLLGHGLSSTPSTPKHYLFESLVQDLTNLFDHFVEEEQKAIIVGHGYGACLGTVLSRIRPKNVCLLISVSGGGPTPMVPPGSFETPLLRLNLFAKKREIGRFDNPELRTVLPRRIHQNLLDGQIWLDGDAAFHRRILVPTLLVYGMRDTVVSMIEECEMERTIPKAFLELIPTAGHMIMWDEPKKFNKMLIKFIHAWLE